MQYLIKANQVILSGEKEVLMQYISNSHKSSIKNDINPANWSTDYASFENFIEALGYTITNKIPSNCRLEGTTITSAQFLKTWKECGYDISETSLKLKIAERNVSNIIKKMKFKK